MLPEAPPLIVGWLSYCVIYALMPLLFLLLPLSRRRGKVRWRHIVRVWIYGLWIPTVTGVSLAAMLVIGAFDNEWWSMIDATIRGVPTWGFGLLIIAWWWSATGRYLRMPHALAIAALLAVLGGLIVLAVIWFGWREFLIEGSWLFSL